MTIETLIVTIGFCICVGAFLLRKGYEIHTENKKKEKEKTFYSDMAFENFKQSVNKSLNKKERIKQISDEMERIQTGGKDVNNVIQFPLRRVHTGADADLPQGAKITEEVGGALAHVANILIENDVGEFEAVIGVEGGQYNVTFTQLKKYNKPILN